MNKLLLIATSVMMFGGINALAEETKQDTIRIYDHVVFYDGYRMADNPDSLVNDGILRHSCSLYSRPLTDQQLNALGDSLQLNVFVHACCDNYDRIGNINLAFVPKGEETYDPWQTDRIEIGRFITPFMNKNKEPSTVPYAYEMNYMSTILRDKSLREKYDLWLEFELFGVPYAANEQVAGCAGRSDVFAGTLEFVTNVPEAGPAYESILVPIVIKKPEYIGANLNNYTEEGTDEMGKTIKNYTFVVPEDATDSQIVLITSNHGANAFGEEYNRRWHYVYFDDELVLSYKPGRESCEPFRVYNTQANGIYGYTAMSDQEWQSFSNWCPGDVIDNRIIKLGAMTAGEHKVTIRVPDAKFFGKQGDIPVSMYFHGLREGEFPAAVSQPVAEPRLSINLENESLKVTADSDIISVELYSLKGELLYRQWGSKAIPVRWQHGQVYVLCVELNDRMTVARKIVL